MKISDWLKGDVITGVITGFVGAITGAKIAEKNREGSTEKSNHAEKIGIALNEMFALNRGEFLHELRFINTSTNGGVNAIIDLFKKAEKSGGLIKIEGKIYREEWITRKLLMIPPKYRATEYPWLNELLEQNKREFFTQLEILNNDGWLQIMRQIKAIIEKNPKVKKAVALGKKSIKNADSFANSIARGLKPASRRLKQELRESRELTRQGGWRLWFDF